MKTTLLLLSLILAVHCGLQCQPGQCVSNNKCVPLTFIQGCTSYRFDGQCEKCQHGYDLDIDGTCMRNQKYDNKECCAQRDLYGICTQCAPGLYLDNNKCKRNNLQGCVVKSGPICKACGNGFQLFNNKCIKTIIGCQQYSNNGACIRCTSNTARSQTNQFSFQLVDGQCLKYKISAQQVTNFVTKCRVKNSNGCVLCQKEYYLDWNKECIPNQPGCLQHWKGRCLECSSLRGFVLDEKTGQCVNKYQLNSVANCAQYDDQQYKCVGCRQGYRLVDNQCVLENNVQIKIKKQCASGYYLASDYRCKLSGGNLVKQYDDQHNGILIVRQPGCIYQNNICQYCQPPFQKIDGKCTIPNCMQLAQQPKSKNDQSYSCFTCRFPFSLESSGTCSVSNCVKYQSNKCVLCQNGYHLKAGQTCQKDDVNCLEYDEDGNCNACADKYFISSIGQCMLKESNCLSQNITVNKMPICTACKEGFFLNRHSQCQKTDPNCQFYVNGVCKTCKTRYFLHDYICFPFSVGCVKYNGKACTQCKKGYTLFNEQCYGLKTLGMKLQGQDDQYDFDIYPIDITKSKYYIENLSPVSQLGQFIYSSAFNKDYLNPSLTFEDTYYNNQVKRSNGWKALSNEKNQYAGFKLNQGQDSVTFYAVQLEFIQKNQIKSFYLEYTKDGINWIRVQNRFFVEQHLNNKSPQYLKENGIITIYFTGIYAQAIRIVIDDFVGWPACRLEFFYYDLLRYRKISNLKSLRYLKESIQSNYVDRLDNQLYINQKYFFSPQFQCHAGDDLACFTGLQLCEPRKVPSIELINENKFNTGLASYVSQFYITYSTNGRSYACLNNCSRYQVTEKDLIIKGNYQNVRLQLGNLVASHVRVYPTKWVGTPKLSITYDYD